MVALAQTKSVLNTNSQSLSVSFDSAPQVDSLIAVVVHADKSTPGSPLGFWFPFLGGVSTPVLQASHRDGTGHVELWTAIKTSVDPETNITAFWEPGGAFYDAQLIIAEFTGQPGDFVPDGAAEVSDQSGNNDLWSAGVGITPTKTKVLSLMVGGITSGSIFFAPTNGWIEAEKTVIGGGGVRGSVLEYHIGGVGSGIEYTTVQHNSAASINAARLFEVSSILNLGSVDPIAGQSTLSSAELRASFLLAGPIAGQASFSTSELVVDGPLAGEEVPDTPREVFSASGIVRDQLTLVARSNPPASERIDGFPGISQLAMHIAATIDHLGFPIGTGVGEGLGLLPGDRIQLIGLGGGEPNDGKVYTLDDPQAMTVLEEITDFATDFNEYEFAVFRRK